MVGRGILDVIRDFRDAFRPNGFAIASQRFEKTD